MDIVWVLSTMDSYSIIIELSLNPVDLSDILLQLFKTVKIMDVLV
jgi:hypothetical protein